MITAVGTSIFDSQGYLAKRCFAFRSLKEVEGSEVGKRQSFVEDEGSFDAAIGQEKIAAKLRQSVSVSSHVFPPCIFSAT